MLDENRIGIKIIVDFLNESIPSVIHNFFPNILLKFDNNVIFSFVDWYDFEHFQFRRVCTFTDKVIEEIRNDRRYYIARVLKKLSRARVKVM